jgi:tetratricopeptide (TPR) repeat protein
LLMPLRRTRRNVARVLALALCLFDSTLLAARADSPAPRVQDGEVAVIDSLVVNEQKQDSATPADITLIRSGTTTPLGVAVGDKLFKGDELITSELDQVTLRFVNVPNGELNLVYVDNNSKLVISSACLKSGRILAWVGINFRFCIGNTNLAVNGTQFVVEAENPAEAKVTVLEGEVTLKPQVINAIEGYVEAPATAALATEPSKIKAKEEAVLTPTGIAKKEISAPTGQTVIDYWSRKMIKADPKQASDSPQLYKSFKNKEERDSAFIAARFDALWNSNAAALETIGKVYNDWERGDKATEVLQLAANRDPSLRTKSEFQATLAEADLLSGRYDTAIARADEILKTKPNDDRAAYIGAKAATQASRQSDGGGGGANLEIARRLYAIALQNAAESAVQKGAIERELNDVIKVNANRVKQVAAGYVAPLKCADDDSAVVFSGSINLPELRSRGFNISGRGELYLMGNQFKLTSQGGKIYTGTLSTTTTGRYTAVALRFDSPSGENKNGITVSLRGQGNCNSLRLLSSRLGSMSMTVMKTER